MRNQKVSRRQKIMISKHFSSCWTFEIGDSAHQMSWGKRSQRRSTSITTKLWSSEDFCTEGKIGNGHFGEVYVASYARVSNVECRDDIPESKSLQDKVALKRFSKSKLLASKRKGGRSIELLQREVNIHSHIAHTCILSFHGFFEDISSFSLVLEYASQGDLLNYCNGISPGDRTGLAREVLVSVCSAVGYLQSLQIAHRDIKPENIVICYPRKFKLCDFGWATWWKHGQRHSTLCGTPEYVPPEMLEPIVSYRAEYVDPWAIGVLALELMQGCTPFDLSLEEESLISAGDDPSSHVFNKIRGFRGFSPVTSSDDEMYHQFVSQLMKVDPVDRLSAADALKHPFLQDGSQILESRHQPTVAQRCQVFERSFERVF